jgi:hypothetical protein
MSSNTMKRTMTFGISKSGTLSTVSAFFKNGKPSFTLK